MMLKNFYGPSKKRLCNFLSTQERSLGSLKMENCRSYGLDGPCASKKNRFAILLINNVGTINLARDRLCKEKAHAL